MANGRDDSRGEPPVEEFEQRKRDLVADGKSRSEAGQQAFREMADKRSKKENG